MDERLIPIPPAARIRGCVAFHHTPFPPVPVKARHDGWTPAPGFIDRLRHGPWEDAATFNFINFTARHDGDMG